jgi:bacterial/archaeal transporter family-2 protein
MMNSTMFYVLMALIAGATLPTQAGINAQLNLWSGSPVLAAAISFAVGTAALILYILALRIPVPALAAAAGHPWWIWTGGTLGAFFVAALVILAPKLGAASMVALVVAGQMIASLVLDHFGMVGYTVHPVNPIRLFGAGLVVVGVILIRLW